MGVENRGQTVSTGIPTTYHHVQRAPLCLIIYATSFWLTVAAYFAREQVAVSVVLLVSTAFVGVLAASFHYLSISDGGNFLNVSFGPVPLFRRRIQYDDIVSTKVGRTSLLEGWGIHWSPVRGGWIWNLWGRDCVVLELKPGILCLGTNEPAELFRFLGTRPGMRKLAEIGGLS